MLSANDVIEGRLTRWGRLARGRCEDLGIPERSVLGRMIEEGFGAGQVSDWSSRHLPDDVVEVDRAVAGLPKRYKKAVRVHYLTDLPTMVKVQLLHTSRRSFYLWVNCGKQGVYDRLVAKL